MKKILFLLSELDSGGAEKVTINIMNLLDKKDYEVHLSVINDTGEWKNLLSEEIILHNLNVSRTIFSVYKLRNLIQRIQPDIIFSTLLRTHISLYLSLFNMNVKTLTILRSPTSPKLLEFETNKNLKLSFLMKYLIVKSYQKADIVFAQTDEMKNELINYYKIKEEKIKVFYNPLDVKNIKLNTSNISNPFDTQKINVLSSGRLSPEKGFDILIYAFAKVVKKNKKFMLHIIGRDVGEKENLLKLIQKLNMQSFIVLHGFKKNPYQFYKYCDLYVLSSYREGMPNTVIENLYLKKPIVATKCAEILNHLIQENKNGYLVEIGDIDDMANKILNYNKLSLEFSSLNQNIEDINIYFKNLKV